MMFCPRCGRTVSETANFCGGCGLPRAEILKYHQSQMATPVIPPVQVEQPPVQEIESTITQLENRLNEDNTVPVNDYTTEAADDTNTIADTVTPSDFIRQEIKAEQKATEDSDRVKYGQSRYSYHAPVYPEAEKTEQPYTPDYSAYREEEEKDYTMSTVDYIWMMIISAVPVVGFIYLLYNAFAAENPNKRSYARAVLIVGIFSCLIAAVFAMGLVMSQLAFFY